MDGGAKVGDLGSSWQPWNNQPPGKGVAECGGGSGWRRRWAVTWEGSAGLGCLPGPGPECLELRPHGNPAR